MFGTLSLALCQLGFPLPTSFQPARQIESSETCIWDKLRALSTRMVSTAFNQEMAHVEISHYTPSSVNRDLFHRSVEVPNPELQMATTQIGLKNA